jgi:hypothetical protein
VSLQQQKINLSLKERDTMYQKTYVAFYKSWVNPLKKKGTPGGVEVHVCKREQK